MIIAWDMFIAAVAGIGVTDDGLTDRERTDQSVPEAKNSEGSSADQPRRNPIIIFNLICRYRPILPTIMQLFGKE